MNEIGVLERAQCVDCGGDARLLVNLSGVTGEAGYELWQCDGCGLTERLGRPRPPLRRPANRNRPAVRQRRARGRRN